MAKKTTALQLFRQQRKIRNMQAKVREEQTRLQKMIGLSDCWGEIIQVDGEVYKIFPKKESHFDWNNTLTIEHMGSVADLSKALA